jgi:hypothetical protein
MKLPYGYNRLIQQIWYTVVVEEILLHTNLNIANK